MHFNLTLAEQVNKMALGDHICLIYSDPSEQMEALAPYLAQGLEHNELCLYILDDLSLSDVRDGLTRKGINVAHEEAAGRLIFATKREAYLVSGEFSPQPMLKFLREAMEAALEKGFSGFRVTGEMTWALGNECGCERLIEYEALLNEFFPGSKATAICQYNRNRFSPKIIRDVLRTHPTAIIDGHVCSNLYYETPDMVLGRECPAERVDWMMGQLKNFRIVQENLESAIKSRDEFLSIASHELRTPLTSLKLQAQGINKIIGKNETDEETFKNKVSKAMFTTEKQVDRLSKLVDDLLDVSQINAGKLRITPDENVNLAELATGVVDRFANQAKESGVMFFTELENVEGHFDRFRIEQVISNLVSNSLKYGKGMPVEVKLHKEGEKALLSIKDNGLGISEEHLDKIFHRFERAVHANEVSGLGLGLYISEEIMEAHNGRIVVSSAPGQGSTFTMELPLAPFS